MVWVTPEWLEARIESLKTELKEVEEEITRIEQMINKTEGLSRHHRYLKEIQELHESWEQRKRIAQELSRAQESLGMLKSN